LIDPNMADLRSQPKEERDLLIAARHSAVLVFDNLSSLPPWLSDALCRLATGSGYGTRALYTNADEFLFDGMRPVVINGIPNVVTRPDLIDRAICLTLLKIERSHRRTEVEFWADFAAARPGIFGAILDGVAMALKRQNEVARRAKDECWSLPRMSDFALWVEAAAPAFGWPEGDFTKDYEENRKRAISIALESDILTPYIRAIAHSGFEGSAAELLRLLTARNDEGNPVPGAVPDQVMRRNSFPKHPNHLSGRLRRITQGMRQQGILIEQGRTNQGSWIVIRKLTTHEKDGGP
jgi:hypothetical protein